MLKGQYLQRVSCAQKLGSRQQPAAMPAREASCQGCWHARLADVPGGLVSGLLASVAAVSLQLSGPSTACAEMYFDVQNDIPLADQANVLTQARRQDISNELQALEQDTGFRVRLLTKERYTMAQMDRFRSIWKVDKSTVILVFDPTAPNIFGYEYIGDNILLGPLRRPFWIELQSRFGNMFYVRDYGAPTAVQSIVDSIDGCLRKGGCQRVPGLPEEQYVFTLVLSVVAGVIAGFSFRLEPNDPVSKRWFWPLLLAPLYGILFISFGLGPVISRTDEWQPVAQNTAAFLVAALLFRPNPIFFKGPDS